MLKITILPQTKSIWEGMGECFPAKPLIPGAVIYSNMFGPHKVPTNSNRKWKKEDGTYKISQNM